MQLFNKFPLIALPMFIMAFTACEKDDNDEPDEGSKTGQVTLQFDHHVAGKPFLMDSMLYENQAGNKYEVTKLEYIVSRFRFENGNGEEVTFDTAHYRNAEHPGTREITLNGVPTGTYTRLRFNHGLDSSMNQVGEVPATEDFRNMAWGDHLPGDYHHMRMEGNFEGPDTSGVFTTHAGASEDSQGNYSNNHVPIGLSVNITVNENETNTLRIRMNLNEWYANPNEYDFGSLDNPGIMGNHARQVMISQNGHNVYSLGS